MLNDLNYKINDFIYFEIDSIFESINKNIKVGKISGFDNNFVHIEDFGMIEYNDILELWKPKYEEYCLFYNDNCESARIAKFMQIGHGQNVKGLYKDMQSNYFKYCEPITFNLPKFLK